MYLGIEIGGTKIQVGVGAGDGILAGLWRGAVDVAAGADGIMKQVEQALPELLASAGVERANLRGVGIGFGGPVDDATQTIIKSHQIAGWDGFPLAAWISEITGLPAALGNDADVAGLAEALFGAGKGLSPIFYITIGSGIGGGLIINGDIYRGCGRGAAEIGHVDVSGKGDQPLEEAASGWAIAESAQRGLPSFEASLLMSMVNRDIPRITAAHVAEAARQGDRYARDRLFGAWGAVARAICQVIVLLCPRRIIIGGGVSLMGENLLFVPLRELVAQAVFEPFRGCYDIVPAALGEEVVVHGAVALARKVNRSTASSNT